jgi:STE24 endopeptidase
MTPQFLFYILIAIIVLEFIWNTWLDYLNALHFNDPIPQELEGVFDHDEYLKSQRYKNTNHRFSLWQSLFQLVLVLAFFFLGGFAWLDELIRQYFTNPIWVSMAYIGVIALASSIISIPFSYYHTFVIEEKFEFNTTTRKTFWLDQIKSLLLSILLGGLILYAVLWFYNKTGDSFWWYTWILVTAFTLFFTLFYSQLIVPLFNKQTPLEEGVLKKAITQFATKTGFTLDNIYVIDGSKRSKKANAYFTGFGPKKRVVLYDTLINDLEIDEIVAVLAHEIGHYQKRHVVYNMIISILTTGLTLFILSLFIKSPVLSQALEISQPSFHIGIIVFGILYSPLSELTGLLMSLLSRKFEYQADAFAKLHSNAQDLINALKKLSKNSLSNLTPHPLYVFWHYSHPTLLQRVKKLKSS